MNKSILKIIPLVFLFLCFALPVLAQDGFGDPGSDVPVDGGLSLLIAAGLGYGAKRIKNSRKFS